MYGHATRGAADLAGGSAKLRCLALSLGASMLLVMLTLGYVAAVGTAGDLRVLSGVAPFLLPAAIAGVAPPSYVALTMLGRKNWLPAAVASAVALLLAFVVFWSAAIVATPRPQEVRMDPASVVVSRPFAKAEWNRYPDIRDRMVEDLVRSRRLQGMTAAQVRALLGKPSAIPGPGRTEMLYQIGTRAGDAPIVLMIRLGSSGKVESAAVKD
jgi:hypothetical protein